MSRRDVTVVLDDDPTGTQEVTAVPVLLTRDRVRLVELLRRHDAVFVLTNTRAVPEDEAVALVAAVLSDVRAAEAELGVRALVVQRGDSTLRGHVFAEVDAAGRDAVAVYCPAFPAGGRRTVDGVHEVRVDDTWLNAADTEFAGDPVFGYAARSQVGFVAEKGRGRPAVAVRTGGVADAVRAAAPGTVVLPDAATDDDVAAIAGQIRGLVAEGVRLVVRSAAPLAAFLAGAKSTALLDGPPRRPDGTVLVVVGSHTGASGAQLARLDRAVGPHHELSTERALADPGAAGAELAARAAGAGTRVVVIASERVRRRDHDTLDHGHAVMTALTTAVRALADDAVAVVAKGGITSAEVARTGLRRDTAWVVGQLEPGVSLWTLPTDRADPAGPGLPYAVVPGNIGDADTLLGIVTALTGP